MSSSISGRTRTPPDLKWLLNERAAIAGRIQKTEARQRSLERQLPRYQRQLEKVLRDLPNVKKSVAAYQMTLESLDTAIGLAHKSVQPDVAGVVNAWAGKYGRRGAFKEYIVQLLQEATPFPLTTREVVDRVIEHFAFPILCPSDRRALLESVRTAFRQLRAKGKVEALHKHESSPTPGIWRWKQASSLADLAAKAQRMAQAAELSDASQEPANHPGSAG